MRELCVNALNYGAAAQTYVGEDVENLANKNLTQAQQNLATPNILNVASDKAVNGDMWVGAGVRFDYSLGLYFVFETNNIQDVTAMINGVMVNTSVYDE